MIYDLIIIGGAMAALSSAVYAARKKINTVILTGKIGGQSLLTDNIENYPGFKSISGEELIQKVKEQVENLGVEIKIDKLVQEINESGDNFEIKTKNKERKISQRNQ